jgi:hypothetical protein
VNRYGSLRDLRDRDQSRIRATAVRSESLKREAPRLFRIAVDW